MKKIEEDSAVLLEEARTSRSNSRKETTPWVSDVSERTRDLVCEPVWSMVLQLAEYSSSLHKGAMHCHVTDIRLGLKTTLAKEMWAR